ncbi:hypothetical protein EV649_0077 [Kribbella sp. VKM Ac-2569]|uniref:hypothetical protein n=1 Tax=Kribbella sp. VKM Ac-2569 TaxID=2512220 RepID=UPI00102CB1E1|nr:hypothetical protein [Kribbella sp. VKM Ac-2569]RZT26334.1 hypothetical protein EV649_0077 [Kribbella sp. VKM Ac-2569]
MRGLERFAFSEEAKYDPQLLSDDLLSRGLRWLCLLGDLGGGTIYEHRKVAAQIPIPGHIKESAITRDAFYAAAAARPIEDRTLTNETIRWAAAAMTSFADTYHQAPTTPPDRASVEERYRAIPSVPPAERVLTRQLESVTNRVIADSIRGLGSSAVECQATGVLTSATV